jgi:Ni/Co efflux regulator RcnB
MSTARHSMLRIVAIAFAGTLAAGVVHADKPSWAGGGNKHERDHESHGRDRDRGGHDGGRARQQHFGDRHAAIVREYYGEEIHRGHCPPGLAKKRNGCLPPGQARKWAYGRPLPAGVVYYEVPPALVVQLGRPPAGYKYVRIATDILMITVGTSMVVDAIQDLGGIM